MAKREIDLGYVDKQVLETQTLVWPQFDLA